MPKQRGNGKDGLKKGTVVSRKFRIGTRKSGKAGHSMTNDDLIALVEKGGKGANKAKQVLAIRGINTCPDKAQDAA